MTGTCAFCSKPLNPHDIGTWKEVVGWVGGPRKDSMRLRADTQRFAHDHCVAKLQSGQAIDQLSLLEDAPSPQVSGVSGTDLNELEGLLDED